MSVRHSRSEFIPFRLSLKDQELTWGINSPENGHKYQAKFHWLCEELGIRHIYIKPRSPHLNGKVERSHKTDAEEFWQLVDYVDIRAKLREWEVYYNYHGTYAALKGKAPFEILRERLLSQPEIV